jgi:hypothetical protein
LWDNEIRLFIVSDSDNGESVEINKLIFKNKAQDMHYYYQNDNDSCFKFKYNDIDWIDQTVIPLLKELEKYKESI